MYIELKPVIGESLVTDIVPKMIELSKVQGIFEVECNWLDLNIKATTGTTKEELLAAVEKWKNK